MAKRGLGKGLNELLSATLGSDFVVSSQKPSAASLSPEEEKAMGLFRLPIRSIQGGPFQPRRAFSVDGLEQLAESIRRQGVLQPIVVRQAGDNYEILAGERRWRAAKLAELTEIPAIVRKVSDEEAMAIGLIENIQREDLNPMDAAKALKRLADEMDLTHLEVAEAVGKSRTSITNLLRLLALNPDVQAYVESGDIEFGHAKALLGVKGSIQSQMARTVVKRGLSVRETERVIQRLQEPDSKRRRTGLVDPNIRRLESDLADKLGANVNIRHSSRGKGTVLIRYNDTEELEGILDHIK
jgi:ParB family chromosome partitioning protein